jgi:hypothetical protein
MSRGTRALLVALLTLRAASALAQGNSQCSSFTGNDLNICNAAIDGAVIFHPVVGMLVSGGNPTLGSFSTLGGFPHFSLSLRVNATQVNTPDLNYDGTGTTVAAADKVTAPFPMVEGSLGIYKGLGMSGLLSVDALGSAMLLPTTQFDNFSVDKNATTIGSVALGFGYGARVGLTNQKAAIPAVSVSVMRRNMPEVSYGDVSSGDQYRYGIDLTATNLRAVAGYHFAVVSFGAGLGWDKYTGSADIDFVPFGGGATQNVKQDLSQTRTMGFLDAGFNLGLLNIMAEAGYQFGKDLNLATTFEDNNPQDNRLFGSAALRFNF